MSNYKDLINIDNNLRDGILRALVSFDLYNRTDSHISQYYEEYIYFIKVIKSFIHKFNTQQISKSQLSLNVSIPFSHSIFKQI